MNKLQTGSVYPWQTELERFIEQVESAPNRVNDGWTHQHKLAVLEKLVRAYALHQDETGAIIDPHSESERYYSTPPMRWLRRCWSKKVGMIYWNLLLRP